MKRCNDCTHKLDCDTYADAIMLEEEVRDCGDYLIY